MSTVQAIVGRERELAQIDAALSDLESGRGGILELVGEPGIGKTRLLSELSSRARERDLLVLGGLAAEFERDLPFGLLIDALDGYLAGAGTRDIERWARDQIPELATVFPSLSELTTPEATELALQGERFKAHRAVRELMEGIAATRPTVLSLDDVQWADEASAEALATLVRRPPAGVLVALAFRAGAGSAVIASARRIAEQEGALTRIVVGPLSDDDAARLLDGDADGGRREVLIRESGGNPFFLTELSRVQRLPDKSWPHRPSDTIGGVPPAVIVALGEELGRLEESETSFLRGAAVAGEPFEPDLAAKIAELQPERGLDVLDGLESSGLVRPTDVPRRFVFRHPLVRRAVYQGSPAGWRLAAHGRAAEALAERGASASQRARHVEQSATPGDPAAVQLLSDAANEVASRAPATAAGWLKAALRLLPHDEANRKRRHTLMRMLATSQAAGGRLTDSEGTILELIRELPADAGPVRMRLIATCATLKDLTGRHEAAREGLLQYRDLIAAGGPDAVTLQTELAINAFWGTDYLGARDWAKGAHQNSISLDDTVLRAIAAAILAYAEVLIGEIEAAERHRDEAAEIIDAHPDEALARRLNSLGHLGWTEYFLGRLDEALGHFERALRIARTSRQGQFLALLQMGQASVLASLGRLADARGVAEEIVDSARLTGNRQALGQGLASVCWWATLEGDLEAASHVVDEALSESVALGESAQGLFTAAAVGEYRLQSGDPGRAIDALESALGGAELANVGAAWAPMLAEIFTRAALAAGDESTARTLTERALAEARALDLPIPLGHARRSEAALLLALDQPGPGLEAALAAAQHYEAAGAATESGRARLLAGKALAALSERERAIEELSAAERLFERTGAARFRSEATRELRRLGKRTKTVARRPGQAGADGLSGLSGREREIAEHVTDRKTNREIAAELVLSEKTIEAHLRNVFAKLGVSSRVDVARIVEAERDSS